MNKVTFLFLRQMRAPLVVLIAAYTISIGGLVVISGIDDQGQPWRFDFFHAFYFVSSMGSTIGFGEIPYAFNDAQRAWTIVAMYLTVIAWLYAIGKILALIQNPMLRRAVTEQRFAGSVKHLSAPFYLICGYGETGSLLVRSLTHRQIQSVVIDGKPERIDELMLEDLSFDVPGLCANVRDVLHLEEAGLRSPLCMGVVALTDVDEVNVKVAITSKLLNPSVKVIARAITPEGIANLESFNTDHIINPFDIFSDHLAMALRSPSVHLLYEWLVGLPNRPLRAPVTPPDGNWIVCGFGRFGRAVHRYMHEEGVPITVIEPDPDVAPRGAVIGRGTEAAPLEEAGIRDAVGIVAATEVDADNLSIIFTARELNPDLYFVARQNRRRNTPIFEAAELHLVMQPSRIIVWRILTLLTNPQLWRFLGLARGRSESWAKELVDTIRRLAGNVTPETWTLSVGPEEAPAVHAALAEGRRVDIGHLLRNPQNRLRTLDGLSLMLVRGGEATVLPDLDEPLCIGDQLLFCTRPGVQGQIAWTLFNPNALEYLETGTERPDGYIWRWLARGRAH